MSRFLEFESYKPKLGQEQRAEEIVSSSFTLKRRRQDMYMLSPYIVPSNSHKRKENLPNTSLEINSHRENDLKDLKTRQKTSNDFN